MTLLSLHFKKVFKTSNIPSMALNFFKQRRNEEEMKFESKGL